MAESARSTSTSDASSQGLSWHQVRVVHGVPGARCSALSHLHDVRYSRAYLPQPPLEWYSIVNSGDHKHLVSGTQVKALANTEEAIAYATTYANKATPKRQRASLVWVASGLSSLVDRGTRRPKIRQLQYLRCNYLQSFGGHGRLDRMNSYLWGGREWGARLDLQGLLQHAFPLF